MMRNLLTSILVALLGAACTGNPVAPPPPSAPEVPPPLPAAPKAVLSVGRGDLTPPFAIVNFTQMVFDGSRSEGDGVTYLLEYGDGATSTEAVTTHRVNPGGSPPTPITRLTARLTVTDRHGRSDSTTQTYFLVSVGHDLTTFWHGDRAGSGGQYLNLYLTQDGATLSGHYWASGRKPFGGRVAGVLTDDRAIRLKTVDGVIEFIGAVELRPSLPPAAWHDPILRLSIRGGALNGSVIEFEFADPY